MSATAYSKVGLRLCLTDAVNVVFLAVGDHADAVALEATDDLPGFCAQLRSLAGPRWYGPQTNAESN